MMGIIEKVPDTGPVGVRRVVIVYDFINKASGPAAHAPFVF